MSGISSTMRISLALMCFGICSVLTALLGVYFLKFIIFFSVLKPLLTIFVDIYGAWQAWLAHFGCSIYFGREIGNSHSLLLCSLRFIPDTFGGLARLNI